MATSELVLMVLAGVGLAAACGFRVFVPAFVVSLAANAGYLELAPGFEWLVQKPVTVALGVASLLEVGAYYIPWLDNFLDQAEAPVAVIAGTILSASVMTDMHPFLQWSLALIAGGGTAGTIQVSTAIVRAGSSMFTGGLGNAVVSTAEATGSVGVTGMGIVFPAATGGVFLVLAVVSIFVATQYFLPSGDEVEIPEAEPKAQTS